ncbi:hypothetical protein CHLRE_01g035500v5 [Chlamydomonas reinhardtii]|uniref:Phosphatidylinositol 3-kinase n=1 Tax=Chlamydomonas reinhardtii TaxID=3055 RepID=A0A2K3E706_CHLRE|nr:uncharacterized protein CHLRE_01g035500v5 [Chlamydomonas reinhardtii]PNW88579.1 hypothetical protein CHLRE_01g035500v5 [Chlamydomonas reinhardtii]
MWGTAPVGRGGGAAATGGTAPGARGGLASGQFSFYVSCDINLNVRVKVSELQGLLPAARSSLPAALNGVPGIGAGGVGAGAGGGGGVGGVGGGVGGTGVPLGHDATWPTHPSSAAATAAAAAAAAAAGGGASGGATGSSNSNGGGGGDTAPKMCSLYVIARLTSCGETLGLEATTAFAEAVCSAPQLQPPSAAAAVAADAAGLEGAQDAAVAGAAGGSSSSGDGLGSGPLGPLLAAGGGGGGGGGSSPGDGSTARWDEWLTFCVKYRDLPPDAQLVLVLVEAAEGRREALVGSSVTPLFSKRGRLKTGPQRLAVWEGAPPCTQFPTSTPGKVPLAHRDRLGRLEHLLHRHQRGDMAPGPGGEWLDALALAEIRRLAAADRAAWRTRPELRLTVLLPLFPHPVLCYQHVAAAAGAAAGAGREGGGAAAAAAAAAAGAGGGGGAGWGGAGKKDAGAGLLISESGAGAGSGPAGGAIIRLVDPEVGRDNPAELKAQKLARGLQRGVLDRDLKPNSEERRRLQAILKLPPNKPLHAEERALLWRFRASLTQDTRALTKFLQCVDWSDATEAKQAAELMRQWAPISAADALELLSPDFRSEVVRQHAVQALQAVEVEELGAYLLQLVQALRYEAADTGSRLGAFLVQRAAEDPALAVQLHWYLFCELDDPGFGLRARALHTLLLDTLAAGGPRSPGLLIADTIRRQVDLVKQLKAVIRELKSSKIKAARATERLREMVSETGACGELTALRVPLPLDPHIVLAGIMPKECSVFKSAMLPLRLSFRIEAAPMNWKAPPPPPQHNTHTNPHPHHPFHGLHGHAPAGASHLSSGSVGSGSSSGAVHSPLGPGGGGGGGGWPPPDPLALLPTRTGIIPAPPGAPDAAGGGAGGASGGAASGAAAASGSHHGHHHGEGSASRGGAGGAAPGSQPGAPPPVLEGYRCCIIYKKGDDLRQDHFVLQMIGLMDRMLKRENLDLRMTPYKVLPTSFDDGLVEFVPSVPLSAVLAEHKTIHRFLALTQADAGGPFGLRAEAVETFVRSCAGYCVMTYILGVGDRHLDNLMLTHDGRLFHIDFGYILGADPKPFPPPMKLCKEMIEAMGGQGSEYYKQFRMYACEAYNILRKRADLILSLFHLMAGASIEAIRADPEKAILKLQDKFRLDFDDEAAVEWMQGLINESATALLPQLVETTHRWAQYWR